MNSIRITNHKREVVWGLSTFYFCKVYSHYKELYESPKLLHLRRQRGGGGVQGGLSDSDATQSGPWWTLGGREEHIA